MSHIVRIVTYNVLSPNLCKASQHPWCDPKIMDNEHRIAAVKHKLKSEMTSAGNAVLCLQEVSRDWNDDLTEFFSGEGYSFHWVSYGSDFSGWMGVALAYNSSNFKLAALRTLRISDALPRPPSRNSYGQSSFFARFAKSFSPWRLGAWLASFPPVAALIPKRKAASAPPDLARQWEMAKSRHNLALFAALESVQAKKSKKAPNSRALFALCTYHMPCSFDNRLVMGLHVVALWRSAAKALSKLLASTSLRFVPLVIAGDFNIKPGDPEYDAMLSGSVTPIVEHEANAVLQEGLVVDDPHVSDGAKRVEHPVVTFLSAPAEGGLPSMGLFRSIYKDFSETKKEPEFTNRVYQSIFSTEPSKFQGTLDYIFAVSNDSLIPSGQSLQPEPEPITATNLRRLLTSADLPDSEIGAVFPKDGEPSDHLMLAATLTIPLAQ